MGLEILDGLSTGLRCSLKRSLSRRLVPDCKISLAFFVLYFHLLLIRSFIRIWSFFFVSWSLLKELNFFIVSFISCIPLVAAVLFIKNAFCARITLINSHNSVK